MCIHFAREPGAKLLDQDVDGWRRLLADTLSSFIDCYGCRKHLARCIRRPWPDEWLVGEAEQGGGVGSVLEWLAIQDSLHRHQAVFCPCVQCQQGAEGREV